MKKYDYWNSFVNTGRIDDYLHYIACTREESMTGTGAFPQGIGLGAGRKHTGADLSAGEDDWPDLR